MTTELAAVVPHYLADLKRRIGIARVDNSLFAFDDLCTCPGRPCEHTGMGPVTIVQESSHNAYSLFLALHFFKGGWT